MLHLSTNMFEFYLYGKFFLRSFLILKRFTVLCKMSLLTNDQIYKSKLPRSPLNMKTFYFFLGKCVLVKCSVGYKLTKNRYSTSGFAKKLFIEIWKTNFLVMNENCRTVVLQSWLIIYSWFYLSCVCNSKMATCWWI